jgi:class 3 adenylate cyclase
MGIHVGEAEAIPDPKSGRMDYFGPPVNRAARVSGAAHGGQIVVSGDAWSEVRPRVFEAGLVQHRELGAHLLKGLATPETLVEVIPETLAGRTFPPPKAESTNSGKKPAVEPPPDGA